MLFSTYRVIQRIPGISTYGNITLPAIRNLCAALSRLRNVSLKRIIRIAAIFIDKIFFIEEQQIQIIAKIYRQEKHVLI